MHEADTYGYWGPMVSYTRNFLGILVLTLTSATAFAQPDPSNWRWEQATDLERQAYSCAASMMILTSASGQPEYQSFGRTAEVAGMVLNDVGAEESMKRLKATVNNGFVHKIRDNEMKVVAASWQIDKPKTIKRFWECLFWGASSIHAIQTKSITSIKEITYPNTFPPIGDGKADNRQRFEKLVNVSMQAWRDSGSLTPSDIKEVIRRDVSP